MSQVLFVFFVSICLYGTFALAEKPEHREVSDDNSETDVQPVKRKFYAWAGKRADNDEPEENEVQKRKFYAWAGKRGDSSEDTREADELDAEAGRADKKKFYSWAGKRSDEETPNDEELEKPSDKRKFYAWAGKRFYKWDEGNEAKKRSIESPEKTP